MMDWPIWVLVALVGVYVSCLIAGHASGGRGTGAWGLLGPLGWLVAAVIGIRLQAEEESRRLAEADRARFVRGEG